MSFTIVNVTSIDYNFNDMARRTKWNKPKELKEGALALSKKWTIRFTSYYDSSEGKGGQCRLID